MGHLTFLVYFVYGLAFFGMGLALALESGRSPALAEARLLRPLAAFGLIHGTHEWLESYLLQGESLGTLLPDWLPTVRRRHQPRLAMPDSCTVGSRSIRCLAMLNRLS